MEYIGYAILIISFLSAYLVFNYALCARYAQYLYGHTTEAQLAYQREYFASLLSFTSLRKVGGIWFWRIGRIGGSFYISNKGE